MEKLVKLMSSIPKDKLLHFFYGTIISFFLYFVLGLVGIVIAIMIAAMKELLYDLYLGRGSISFTDFVFSIISSLLIIYAHYN